MEGWLKKKEPLAGVGMMGCVLAGGWRLERQRRMSRSRRCMAWSGVVVRVQGAITTQRMITEANGLTVLGGNQEPQAVSSLTP